MKTAKAVANPWSFQTVVLPEYRGSRDRSAPTKPSNIAVVAATQRSLKVVWRRSRDNRGVAGYGVYVDRTLVRKVAQPGATVKNLACETKFRLQVDAYDRAGNRSARATLTASTRVCPAPRRRDRPSPRPPPTDPADVFIAPSGSDANACTQKAPCASFNRAYAVAALGDVVEMACGTYPAQTITEKTGKDGAGDLPNVVFRPAKSCPTVRVVDLTLGTYVNGNGPDHITLRGLSDDAVRGNQSGWNFGWDTTDVTIARFDTGSVYLDGTNGVTLRKGDLGPCDWEHPAGSDCSNSKLGLDNANTLIDGVTFHEYYCNPSNCHFECLIVFGARGITVRNSKFYLCDVYDIFFQGDRGRVRNVTLENNWFDQPLSPNIANGRRNPSYGRNSSVEFSRVGYSRVLIRFNSFHSGGGITFDCCAQTTFRVVGNIMRFGGCASGVGYAYNVQLGGTCSGTDVNAPSPRYVNGNHLQNGGNFHLTGGVAVGRVRGRTSDYLLARDIDGQKRPRGATRDAGSDEH